MLLPQCVLFINPCTLSIVKMRKWFQVWPMMQVANYTVAENEKSFASGSYLL
jgi:hypothetical protein